MFKQLCIHVCIVLVITFEGAVISVESVYEFHSGDAASDGDNLRWVQQTAHSLVTFRLERFTTLPQTMLHFEYES